MDVNQAQFSGRLLSILEHIANANFISFDLEMSGIATRSRFGPNPKGHDGGKPTLRELYDETRMAAETFQVLQVGITCAQEDREKGFYLLRPFNFNLSPLLYMESTVKDRFPERKIVLSSSAVDFLQREGGFNIGKVFTEGVYYLSHADEEEARRRFQVRTEQREVGKYDDISSLGDQHAQEFICYARNIINVWVNAKKQEYPFVNVGDPKGGDLNAYQRFLIHQLVRKEFPLYKAIARNNQSFMQVEKVVTKREAELQAKNLAKFNDALAKQIGLRFVFEALTGGDLSKIPINWFVDEYTENPELSQVAIQKKFAEVQKKLKSKREAVVVGHNLFTDLVCLYKTFVGPLPERVEEFQERIHNLFPVVFDTKYLATEGHDSMSTVMRQNLGELLESFKNISVPLVLLHEEHMSYITRLGKKKHEAGFDSYMTAELFIKLSAQIYHERKRFENFGGLDPVLSHPVPDDESQTFYSGASNIYHTPEQGSADSSENSDGGAKLSRQQSETDLMDFSAPVTQSMSDHQPAGWHADQLQKLNYSDYNPFQLLAERPERNSITEDHKLEQWLPKPESPFWHLYVNKLRVNASEGGICNLSERF